MIPRQLRVEGQTAEAARCPQNNHHTYPTTESPLPTTCSNCMPNLLQIFAKPTCHDHCSAAQTPIVAHTHEDNVGGAGVLSKRATQRRAAALQGGARLAARAACHLRARVATMKEHATHQKSKRESKRPSKRKACSVVLLV